MAHPLDSKDVAAALDDLRLASDRRLASVGLALLLLPAVWGVRADWELFSHDWPLMRDRLILRACLITVSLVGLILVRAARSRDVYSLAATLIAWTIGVLLAVNMVIRPANSGLAWRLPVTFLAVAYFALPNSRWRQIGPPLCISVALVGLRLTWLSEGGVNPEVDVVAIVTLNAIGVLTVSRRLQLEAATIDAVGRLHALHGMIPICSHCRKVRSDVTGWQQLERYVRDRSDARFSREICPDCLKKHGKELI